MLGSYRKDFFLLHVILIISADTSKKKPAKIRVHRNALSYIMQDSEFVLSVEIEKQMSRNTGQTQHICLHFCFKYQ